MKKLLLALTVLSTLTLTGCFQSSSNGGGVLLKPERVYEVDGWGTNPDIIQFTPVGRPDMTCLILVNGNDKASGLSCFPKLK